jgi:mRNA-degrading endonuclease YafQ of YafQ-DinJ toxin-antitoxin module
MEIHQTRRFAKQLEALTRADKSGKDAVQRAREIITRLQHNPIDPAAENKRTHHGELRLKNCRKYDLACGFRLIGLRREKRLIFVFIGSHDDYRLWIDNNRYSLDEIDSEPIDSLHHDQEKSRGDIQARHEPDEYEQQLSARLDDRLLREVFSIFS